MRIWSLSDAQAANRRPSSPARPRPPPESCVVGTRRTSAQCPPIPLPERAHDHFPCPPTAEPGVSELIGAEHGERRPEDRATHRNGYRPRRWDTRAGEIELQIPKIRQGSYFPSFLQPRKRSEQALLSVVQQALCVRREHAPRRPARREPRVAGQAAARSAASAPGWMS